MRPILALLALFLLVPAAHADVFDADLDLNFDYIEVGTVVTGTETIDTVNGFVNAVNLVFHLDGVDYPITTADITFSTLTFPTTTSPYAASDNVFQQTVSTPELTGQLDFDLHQSGSLIGLSFAEFCDGFNCEHIFPNGGFSDTDYLILRSDPANYHFNNFGLLLPQPPAPVPEPSSLALLGTGLAGSLTLLRHRRPRRN